MWQLHRGDVFRLGELGTFRAHCDPYKNGDMRSWGIDADATIDPETNEWVELTSEDTST
jgi:hypothetical protein